MKRSISQLKALLVNSMAIKIDVDNPNSISVNAEGEATREHILKRFASDLIKLDLWFHILNLVSQRNLPPQITLVKV